MCVSLKEENMTVLSEDQSIPIGWKIFFWVSGIGLAVSTAGIVYFGLIEPLSR